MADKQKKIPVYVINTPKRPMSDKRGCDMISGSKKEK